MLIQVVFSPRKSSSFDLPNALHIPTLRVEDDRNCPLMQEIAGGDPSPP